MSQVIVGLGFGDEGKGLTTSYLCSRAKNPIVVRFSGGHQAGHTVVHEGTRHVFSNFGSGSLQGVPTYWSRFCTVHPTGVYKEYERLGRKDLKLILHPLCPVTTPYDIASNQQHNNLKYGSVGVGFGDTIQRQEDNYKLFVQDLYYPRVFAQKLKAIRSYYVGIVVPDNVIAEYLKAVEWLTKFVEIEDERFLQRDNVIYEGSQGILLDKDFGFFPNVTRSNTTSKQALMHPNHCQEVYYVTRCYQTRHGNGPMTNEVENLNLVNNQNETNKENPYQGKFRVGHLDPELLNYALACDHHYSKGLKINLVITCLDQFAGTDAETILKAIHMDFDKVFTSHGPSLTDIKQIR